MYICVYIGQASRGEHWWDHAKRHYKTATGNISVSFLATRCGEGVLEIFDGLNSILTAHVDICLFLRLIHTFFCIFL